MAVGWTVFLLGDGVDLGACRVWHAITLARADMLRVQRAVDELVCHCLDHAQEVGQMRQLVFCALRVRHALELLDDVPIEAVRVFLGQAVELKPGLADV